MALYEYKCINNECGHEFEENISIKLDSKTHKCPKCGKMAEKQISRSSFALKGGGWYADGYSNKGK